MDVWNQSKGFGKCSTWGVGLSSAYTVCFLSGFWSNIWATWLIFRPDFHFVGHDYVCSVLRAGYPLIYSQQAVGRSDKFLACQKVWSSDSGFCTVEEAAATSRFHTDSPFISHRACAGWETGRKENAMATKHWSLIADKRHNRQL